MKKSIIYFVFLTQFNLNIFGQNLIQLSNLEPQNLLKALFEVKTFDKGDEGLWKPNTYESINMPISDDGFCHTKVDTIIYQTSVDENNAIVIFKSNKYDSGIPYTCHACPLMLSIATFTKRDNKWELNQFKKKFKSAGFYGENLGYFEIKRLGKNLNCLHHYEEIDGNNGFDSGMGYFYSIENNDDFEKVFQYLYYDSNSAGVEKNGYDEETKIKILKTNNYYKIESITKRLNSPTIKKRNFVYSVEHKYFIPNEVKK